jgi:hypothetical protein
MEQLISNQRDVISVDIAHEEFALVKKWLIKANHIDEYEWRKFSEQL